MIELSFTQEWEQILVLVLVSKPGILLWVIDLYQYGITLVFGAYFSSDDI